MKLFIIKYVGALAAAALLALPKISPAETEMPDETVLAKLPIINIPGFANEEGLYRAQKKANLVDMNLAVVLARNYLKIGQSTDDVRRYGSALAILDSVPVDQRNNLEYLNALADTQSLLHLFDEARKTLHVILAKKPHEHHVRQKLLYLEILHGNINHASELCSDAKGFVENKSRSLCKYQVGLARGRLLSAVELASTEVYLASLDLSTRVWAYDIKLDHLFLECWKIKNEAGCPIFAQNASKYAEVNAGDHTRISYLADRLIMIGHFNEVLKIIPADTKNFANATRRLAAAIQNGEKEIPQDMYRFVKDTIALENDRREPDHSREAALFFGLVERDVPTASKFSLINWAEQREFVDSWLIAKFSNTESRDSNPQLKQWADLQKVHFPWMTAL